MIKYPRNHQDVEYYAPGRKRRVSGSTKSIRDILVMAHEEHPEFTVTELRDVLSDNSQRIVFQEALDVLDAYITSGYGDLVPDWGVNEKLSMK